jgi:hypothetical protein
MKFAQLDLKKCINANAIISKGWRIKQKDFEN